jgi:hypothetical protein
MSHTGGLSAANVYTTVRPMCTFDGNGDAIALSALRTGALADRPDASDGRSVHIVDIGPDHWSVVIAVGRLAYSGGPPTVRADGPAVLAGNVNAPVGHRVAASGRLPETRDRSADAVSPRSGTGSAGMVGTAFLDGTPLAAAAAGFERVSDSWKV